MWCGVDARGTVERLLSKSTHLHAIADCGWRKDADTSSKLRKPAERAITSESDESTDSEVLSVRYKCLGTTNTSMVLGSELESIEMLDIETRIPSEIISWQISLFNSIDCV